MPQRDGAKSLILREFFRSQAGDEAGAAVMGSSSKLADRGDQSQMRARQCMGTRLQEQDAVIGS
jgi:hypothetical protein